MVTLALTGYARTKGTREKQPNYVVNRVEQYALIVFSRRVWIILKIRLRRA